MSKYLKCTKCKTVCAITGKNSIEDKLFDHKFCFKCRAIKVKDMEQITELEYKNQVAINRGEK